MRLLDAVHLAARGRAAPLGAVATVLVAWLLSPAAAAAAEPSLQVCLAAAADRSPVYPTDVFPAGATTEVAAVFRLPERRSRKLEYAWTAVDVGEAAPPNYEIARGGLALGPESDRGVVRLTGFRKAMPVGRYRLDVSADGEPWRSVDFRVVPSGPAPPVARPADLLPLSAGTVWTYAVVQEAGPVGRLSLPPGATAGADGKYRATATMTVAGTDEAGTRVESRRDGAVVFEEWWRLDQKGWSATRRKTPTETVEVDPPQLLVRLPLRPQTWHYMAKDHSYRQTYRMWGPLPLRGPQGEAPGYVVLTEQPVPPGSLTVERHIIPGIGLVKEIIVQALRGEMLSRQELILTGVRRP